MPRPPPPPPPAGFHPPSCADEVIDLLLDQPAFECDPVNRLEGDTPLHAAIRWLNAEPPAQRPFGRALVAMMLEAGSSPRARNRAGLTPLQLVDPANEDLRALIRQHEYASLNAADFVAVDAPRPAPPPPPPASASTSAPPDGPAPPVPRFDAPGAPDDDANFSGSDDDDGAEWERRKKERGRGG